jgi:hypothetical protein
MRTASVLVGFCSSFAPFCELLNADCIGVGIIDELPNGWVFIGPVVDLRVGILDNPARPIWFVKICLKSEASCSGLGSRNSRQLLEQHVRHLDAIAVQPSLAILP